MIRLLLISMICLAFGCKSNKIQPLKCKIQQYKIGSKDSNNLQFWYLLHSYHSGSYYYCYCPISYVIYFSSTRWYKSNTKPSELNNIKPNTEIEVSLNELPYEIQSDMEPQPGVEQY